MNRQPLTTRTFTNETENQKSVISFTLFDDDVVRVAMTREWKTPWDHKFETMDFWTNDKSIIPEPKR